MSEGTRAFEVKPGDQIRVTSGDLSGWWNVSAVASADDCDESEPDERDQEIGRLRDAMTRWAERCAVMASEHAAYRRDTETLRKAAQAAVSRLEAEITDCRAALAAATPKPPEPPPNPLYRALAVRGDGVVR